MNAYKIRSTLDHKYHGHGQALVVVTGACHGLKQGFKLSDNADRLLLGSRFIGTFF